MFGSIKEVLIVKENMLGISENFTLKINDDKNIIEYTSSNKKPKYMYIDNESVLNFLDKFLRITDSWNEEYIDNTMQDGMEWQVIIRLKNEKLKSFIGKNDYPNNFEALDQIVKELVSNIEDQRV